MFGPITLPFGAKMLFNTVRLKPGVSFDQVEMAVGELCSVVKETYGGDKGGFIAGQVFKFSGFVSESGSLTESRATDDPLCDRDLLAIVRRARKIPCRRSLQRQVCRIGDHVLRCGRTRI